jgi:hypothetical protein
MQGTRDGITGIDKELIAAVTAVPSNLGEPTGNALSEPPATSGTPCYGCAEIESLNGRLIAGSAPESPAYPMVDEQQDNGPYQ